MHSKRFPDIRHLVCIEEAKITKDLGITEISELPRPGKIVSLLVV
jgi:hypothetical protein